MSEQIANTALMPRQTTAVERRESGAKRVLATMVSDTLAIAQKRVSLSPTAPNQEEIESWYQKGLRYYKGTGVPKDYVESAKWFRKAAEQGNAKSQNHLGVCYSNGEGVPKKFVEAVEWYRRAAIQGLAKAQFNLGSCYDSGEGVSKDEEEAFAWFCKAAEQGLSKAQRKIALCSDDDSHVLKDYIDASVQWLLDNLAMAQGSRLEVEKKARKAAEIGTGDAQCVLGWCYGGEGGLVAHDDTEAAYWYRRAAERDHAVAQWYLGLCYEYGTGVLRDNAEAYKWFRVAGSKGIIGASSQLTWLSSKMSKREIQEGERRYNAFKAGHPK